jgi:hypothetical protein
VVLAATHFCACSQTVAAADFASRADVIRILHDEQFQVVHRVEKIPYDDLVAAKVIEPGRRLASFIANPTEEFQASDSWVDVTKPRRQLILAAISARYEVICLWNATQGGLGRYFMLIHRAGPKSRVVFYAILDGDVERWADVERLIFRDKVIPLISAELPHHYDEK